MPSSNIHWANWSNELETIVKQDSSNEDTIILINSPRGMIQYYNESMQGDFNSESEDEHQNLQFGDTLEEEISINDSILDFYIYFKDYTKYYCESTESIGDKLTFHKLTEYISNKIMQLKSDSLGL